MRIRQLTLAALAALTVTVAAIPSFAHDGWGWQEHQSWRERAWIEHQQREHFRRDRERQALWQQRQYGPDAHRYGPPPAVYHGAPSYWR